MTTSLLDGKAGHIAGWVDSPNVMDPWPDRVANLEHIRRLIVEPTVAGVKAELDTARSHWEQSHRELKVAVSKGYDDLQSGLTEKIDDHEQRLRTIEKQGLPAWAWSLLMLAVALAGAILGKSSH